MELLLHIGQSKTGTSYIQSSLALGADILTGYDISYPLDPNTAEDARAGRITSGNYWPREGALLRVLEAGRQAGKRSILISSESIFHELTNSSSRFLDIIQDYFPDANIKVLCYIRNPLEHAVSVYQQRVKRGGYIGTLSQSLEDYHVPALTVEALSKLKGVGAKITVLNYSRCRDHLLETLEDWLTLPSGVLPRPIARQVNRSLTRSELDLQIAFNAHLGSISGRLISDPLCNELPDIDSEAPLSDPESIDRFLKRMRSECSSTGYLELVPEKERPQIEPNFLSSFVAAGDDQGDRISFDRRQIEVLAKSLADEIKKVEVLRNRLQKLGPS